MMLKDKNILIGVCGSIAAYKSAELVRLFVKGGANVKVVMTPNATQFISPLTLSTLSKNPVFVNYFKAETGEWNNHVELGLWANLIIIAPITANSIAKMANGFCDNLLTAVYLSSKCPIYFAPAMDLDMWKHSATQQNIQKLRSFGNILIKPANGELASGLIGEGRLAEPQYIYNFIIEDIIAKGALKGKKVLITAGPTQEQIDPVRYISNHSSGKMGYTLAKVCANLGAEVTLISGPTALQIQHPNLVKINVVTAAEMYDEVHQYFPNSNICIMCAAVADYTIKEVSHQKIKKSSLEFSLDLVKTPDILESLGKIKNENQILVGFALETNDEEKNAIKKLHKKNLDLIILNSLKDAGAGFKADTNKIIIIDKNLNKNSFSLKSKDEVAKDICSKIIELL
jgi:phosphopantothenoylcysteine decarboxylase/phosphopantothenate--cysteine ligase